MENLEDVELDQLDGLVAPEGAGELSLPNVVVREILENLSSADCLKLSLVSKVWHYEALSVLRDRGTLTAKMNSADGRCKDLRAFASDLRRMKEVRKVVPFSGLAIVINGANDQHGDWCEESESGELVQIYEDIVGQIKWKHLAVDLKGDSVEDGKNCAGFQLVKKIMQKHSCSLEELSLEIGSNRQAFIQHFLQNCKFSSLTTLKFKDADYYANEDLIKTLVSRAPKLKVLSTDSLNVNLKENLLEGRAAAVHAIDDAFSLNFNDEIPESAVGRLRLRAVWLVYESNRQDFNLEKFKRMTRMMLQTSRTTLSSLRVDAMYLVSWINDGIQLGNVRELGIMVSDSDVSDPRSRRLLKTFDFSRVFPNLSSVEISCSRLPTPRNGERARNALIDMAEEGINALIPPVNPTANIKKLGLDWSPSVPDSFARFLVQMFPDIEKLSIRTRGLSVRCWDYWLDLEELELHLMPEVLENVDGAFCGIFSQEVAELRERDEEYLRSVNIVPVMPSLPCLKRLRTLRVCFEDWFNGGATSMLSIVTGLVAFRRCPNLTVTLATNRDGWRQELLQMEPYASVELIPRPRIGR